MPIHKKIVSRVTHPRGAIKAGAKAVGKRIRKIDPTKKINPFKKIANALKRRKAN